MASRASQLMVPEDPFERAEWLSTHWLELLAGTPLSAEGWGVVARLEREIFPRAAVAVDMDPACPQCGVETDDGTVERIAPGMVRVSYFTCGHSFEVSDGSDA